MCKRQFFTAHILFDDCVMFYLFTDKKCSKMIIYASNNNNSIRKFQTPRTRNIKDSFNFVLSVTKIRIPWFVIVKN